MTLRLYARSDELKRYAVLRAMNREIKILFDKHKIEIPFPQVVVHTAKDE
jgi:small-conductance mechanosensitive channel